MWELKYSELRNQKVVDAFEDTAMSASYKYKLLEMLTELDAEVVEEIEKKKLPFATAALLSNPELKKKAMVSDLKDFSTSKSETARKADHRTNQDWQFSLRDQTRNTRAERG